MIPEAPRVAVIGAGITGLTTAYRLQQRGARVHVYEAGEQPGGRIGTVERDGYLLERGPHTLLERNMATVRLIDDLGLSDAMVVADEEANRRYIVRDGRDVPIPMSPGDFLDSDLLSTGAKLRLLLEPFISRGDEAVDESLANFIRRRLGPEVLDYAVNPFVAGIYAGSPRLLSTRHAFKGMWELEHDYGSLVRGAIARALTGGGSDEPRPQRRLVSFEGGLKQVIDRLADALGDRLLCDARVQAVDRHDNRWHVRTDGEAPAVAERSEANAFNAVVWTGTADGLAGLKIDGDTPEAVPLLEEVEYPPVAVVAMGFDRDAVGHPLDGFGLLVPEREPYKILGSLFISTIFPNRAPDGRALLSTFVGGARHPDLTERDDAHLESLVRGELGELLDVAGEPDLVEIVRWPRAIPQYEVGYGRLLSAIDALERKHPGLYISGNFRDGIALPDLIEAADERAETIIRQAR